MRGSVTIGHLFGIPLRVHWSFLLLVGFFAIAGWTKGGPLQALTSTVFIVALFACVVVHELAHSLVGRHFGVKVESITLLPIGGVSAMEEMPKKPHEELVTAIVGPLTSLAIAVVLGFAAVTWHGPHGLVAPFNPLGQGLLTNLVWTNLVIAGFNLLPAFPMDGGRVLRAVLAHYMGQVPATQIAAGLGQGVAALLILAGLFANIWLVLIGIFIFFGAGQESKQVQMQALLDSVPVQQAMVQRFETLRRDQPLQTALGYATQGYQHDFPVVDGDTIVGIVTRQDLLQGLYNLGPEHHVGEVMTTNVCQATPQMSLGDLYRSVAQGTCGIVLVRDQDRIVGLVTPESVRDHLMAAAVGQRGPLGGLPI